MSKIWDMYVPGLLQESVPHPKIIGGVRTPATPPVVEPLEPGSDCRAAEAWSSSPVLRSPRAWRETCEVERCHGVWWMVMLLTSKPALLFRIACLSFLKTVAVGDVAVAVHSPRRFKKPCLPPNRTFQSQSGIGLRSKAIASTDRAGTALYFLRAALPLLVHKSKCLEEKKVIEITQNRDKFTFADLC